MNLRKYMKHPFLLFIVLICSSLSSRSQDKFIRVNIGVARTNAINDSELVDGYKSGFLGQITYNQPLTDYFYWGIGLGYANKGFKDEVLLIEEIGGQPNPVGVAIQNWNFNYLNIPAYLGFQTGNRYTFFTELGLVPGILTKSTVKLPISSMLGTDEIDIMEFIDDFDLSIHTMLGLRQALNKQMDLDFNVSYQRSLLGIEFQNIPEGENRFQHYGFAFSIGFAYKI